MYYFEALHIKALKPLILSLFNLCLFFVCMLTAIPYCSTSYRVERRHTWGVKVSNVPSTSSSAELSLLFNEYGPCDVRMGENSMELQRRTERYYTYINFNSRFDAMLAADRMNGYKISGTRLIVKLQGTEPAAHSRSDAASPTHTIKVTNIAKVVTEGDLTNMFSFSGAAHNIIVSLKLNQTNADVNFAYVNYASSGDADRAVQILNGGIISGLKLAVKHHGRGTRETTAREAAASSSSTLTSSSTCTSASSISAITNPSTSAATSSTSGSSVKVVITEGSVDGKELHYFFSQFGELKDVPKIRSGSPNYAYVNFKNAADAKKASQYGTLPVKSGVTIRVRPPSNAPVPKPLASTAAANSPFQWKPNAPQFESRKIQCSAIIAQILTSSDPTYVQHQDSIAPVTINREKNGSGIVLFGANSSLPAAESLVRALITDLQHQYTEKVIELPCLYIPAFCNQALVNSLSDIEQECYVRFLVYVTPQCMQDIVSFSAMVHSKLASLEAVRVSSLGIPISQRDATDLLPSGENRPASFVWSFKDDHHSYTPYDPASCAKAT